jgi:anti-anti-sigma regulatory factor
VIPSHESRPVFFALLAPSTPVAGEAVLEFGEQLDQAIAAGSTRLLVDLRRAGPVGTGVLNALLKARGSLLRRGGRIALVVRPGLKRFCEASGLDRRFLVADDRLAAAEQLGLIASPSGRGDLRSRDRRVA